MLVRRGCEFAEEEFVSELEVMSPLRAKTSAVVDQSSVVVAASPFLVVNDHRIVEVSSQLSTDLGIGPQEIVGRPIEDMAVDPTNGTLEGLLAGTQDLHATALPHAGGIPVTLRRLGAVDNGAVFEVRCRYDDATTVPWSDTAARAIDHASSLGVFAVTRSPAILFATQYVRRVVEELSVTEQFTGVVNPESILAVFVPEAQEGLIDAFSRGFTGETVEVEVRTVAEKEQWLRMSVSPAPGEAVVVVVQDVTDLIRAQRKLRESTRLLEALDNHSDDLVLVFDADGQSRFVSQSVRRIAGHDGAVNRREALSMVHPQDVVQVAELYERTTSQADIAQAVEATARARIMAPDGSGYRWHDIIVTNHLHDPDIRGVVWTIRDTHDRYAAEMELAHRATHDELTGLPERASVIEFLDMALQADGGQGGHRTGVLFCDVDNFKAVNDSLGHAAGDVLLTVIADRLRGAVRDGDLVGRWGGDEFVIVAPHLGDFDEASVLADRVFDAFRGTVHFAGLDLEVGVSVGVATSVGGQSAEALMQQADIAMYEAKRNGRGRIEAFTGELSEHAAVRARTESELADAVEHGEMLLHYQPIRPLDPDRRLPSGMEALARWQHPEQGLLGPDRFIHAAEESGFMSVLGMELLRIVVRDVSEMNRTEPVFFAVNMSPRQLSDPAAAKRLVSMITDIALEPQCLVVETTEESFEVDSVALDSLWFLHNAGVRIFLDDFGTGHSSMTGLHRFPVAGLKIDRSLISPRIDEEFVRLVVGVAKAMGTITVAEGIETAHQFEVATRLGVDYGQGFLLGRPEELPGR